MTEIKIVFLFFVGLFFFWVLARVVRRASSHERKFSFILAVPVAALFGGGDQSQLRNKPRAQPFLSALSPDAFGEVREWAGGLKAGKKFEIPFGVAKHPLSEQTVRLADGWIGDYSGRYLTGNPQFGHPVGLEGDRLYGNHLFGYLHGSHFLVPAFRLVTRARAVWNLSETEAAEKGFEAQDTLHVDGESRPLYLRKIEVDRVIPMESNWQYDPELAGMVLTDRPTQVEAVFKAPLTRERFAEAERRLRALPKGCERWEMMEKLGGQLMTLMGYDAVLVMDGYLNFKGDHRWSKTTPEGVFLAQPFGYLKGNREVPQVVAIMRNNLLHDLLPFAPKAELERMLGI